VGPAALAGDGGCRQRPRAADRLSLRSGGSHLLGDSPLDPGPEGALPEAHRSRKSPGLAGAGARGRAGAEPAGRGELLAPVPCLEHAVREISLSHPDLIGRGERGGEGGTGGTGIPVLVGSRLPGDRRRQQGNRGGPPPRRVRRAQRRPRPDHRRDGHGQGARRPCDPSRLAPRCAGVRRPQLSGLQRWAGFRLERVPGRAPATALPRA
jgi:hypothetical protein